MKVFDKEDVSRKRVNRKFVCLQGVVCHLLDRELPIIRICEGVVLSRAP